jgi:thymidylate synthase (FAD)
MDELKVHNHGFVRLVDTMPQKNLDNAIVQAARVSYGDGTKSSRSDRGLIRYLLRHWHTTPFEMVEFKFHMKMPLFVARQHLRHRMASINEVSARYSEVRDEFFVPDEFRKQADVNRQGSSGVVDTNSDMIEFLEEHNTNSYSSYMATMEEDGVCREQARMILPQTMYTEFYWKINLHNLMHYLHLRMDNHAQEEIRDYACAIFHLIRPLLPHTMEAFKDFRLDMVHLTGPEVRALKVGKTELEDSPGENREFQEKVKNLNLRPIQWGDL